MVPSLRCPNSQADALGYQVLKAAMAQQVGVLPHAGGMLEQSAKLDEMIGAAASELALIQRARDEAGGPRG